MEQIDAYSFAEKLNQTRDELQICELYDAFWRTKPSMIDYDTFVSYRLGMEKVDGSSYSRLVEQAIAETSNILSVGPIMGVSSVERRQRLIDCIGNAVDEAVNEVSTGEKKSRFLILHIIIDVVYAYMNGEEALQICAMFFQLMQNWNQEKGSVFQEFYGKGAEKEILERSYIDTARNVGEEAYAVIVSSGHQAKKAYHRTFCEELIKYLDGHRPKAPEPSNMQPQSAASSKKVEKTRKKEQPLESFVENPNHWMKKVIFFVLLAIVALLIALFVLVSVIKGKGRGDHDHDSGREPMFGVESEAEEEPKDVQDIVEPEADHAKEEAQEKSDYVDGGEEKEPVIDELPIAPSEDEVKGDALPIPSVAPNPSGNLEPSTKLKVGDIYTVTGSRFIRAKKSGSAEKIGSAMPGDTFEVLEEEDEKGWIGVQFEKKKGYICVL